MINFIHSIIIMLVYTHKVVSTTISLSICRKVDLIWHLKKRIDDVHFLLFGLCVIHSLLIANQSVCLNHQDHQVSVIISIIMLMIIVIVTLEWVQEYQMQYPDASRLQAEVNEFMANYDAKKEQVFSQCLWFVNFIPWAVTWSIIKGWGWRIYLAFNIFCISLYSRQQNLLILLKGPCRPLLLF